MLPENSIKLVSDLGRISAHLPGIGGEIKQMASHFKVTEIPLYKPTGTGEHIFVELTRHDQNTKDLACDIARVLNISERLIGTAGLKDKYALSTQTFSIHLPGAAESDIVNKIVSSLDVKCRSFSRHRNKLKTGHLAGNGFEILVTKVCDNAFMQAVQKKEYLLDTGIPNYYGPQRFGRFGDNHIQGREILLGKRKAKSWKKRFLLSAYQSCLFNKIISGRIQAGFFNKLLLGDLAQKTDTGGLFVVENPEVEQTRFCNREIDWTGPIYGKKMKNPVGLAGKWESELLLDEGIETEDFANVRLDGTRRQGRIFPKDLVIEQVEQGIQFTFSLSAGSYATMLLREFME